jgi:autotransporter-associated beta strand protein
MFARARIFTGLAGVLVVGLPARAQTAVWAGGGPDQNYSTPGNWVGGVVPPNTGAYTVQLSAASNFQVNFIAPAVVAGLQVQGYPSFEDYYLSGDGGSLTIGSGGISTLGTFGSYLLGNVPVILSASQTWATTGYIDLYGPISETGGSRSLTTMGDVYLDGNNTFTGGITVASGQLYLGSNTSAGTGPITIASGATLDGYDADIPNSVTLAANVSLASYSGYGYGLTLSGPITLQSSATTIYVNNDSSVSLSGAVSGPPSTTLTITGYGPQLTIDGGSQLVFQGSLSQVTGIDVENAALILAPNGPPGSSLSGLSTVQVGASEAAYLGLDGTFATTPGAVSSFISTYGPALGPVINGTLGFDTVASPGSPNVFSDPIDLTQFTSPNFIGLGSETAAVLSGAITPTLGNTYPFGGGGGTLTVTSDLDDASGTRLIMNGAPEPLTLVLQGANNYTGGTLSNGGVLIFDSPPPTSGLITLNGGYVGDTENASLTAQQFVQLFSTGESVNGVIGFDSANPGSPRTICGPIDLTAFDSDLGPFIGTATEVTLMGTITPANNQFEFTGVKGGRLTVASSLGDDGLTPNGVTIGLPIPIETGGSTSVVNITGDNTYTGGTTINSGTVFINSNTAFGAASGVVTVPDTASTYVAPYLASFGGAPVTIANPISLASIYGNPGLTAGNTEPSEGDMLVLNGVISDYLGTPGVLAIGGPVTLGAANTYSGGTNITGQGSALALVTNASSLGTGDVTVQSYGALAPLGADVALGNNFHLNYGTLTLGQPGDPNRLTLNGVIDGTWGLEIDSAVTLNGANTFSGGTYIDQANVIIGNSGALGTGPVSLYESTLGFSASQTILDLSDPYPSTTSLISLSPGQTLTLDTDLNVGQPAVYMGTIAGDGTNQVLKTGLGAEYLGGNSTYGGGTSVLSGVLVAGSGGALGTGGVTVAGGAGLGVDSGVTLTNPITLNPGGGLGGRGTFSPPGGVVFSGGSLVSPGGNGYVSPFVATLSFGTPVTFGAGGIYVFDIETAGGAAGSGYDTLSISSSLTIGSTPVAPFTIALESVNSTTGLAGMANFNPLLPYSWTLLTASSGISNFNPSYFSISTASFQNSLGGGGFTLVDTGAALSLDFTPVPEPSTWMLMLSGIAAAGAACGRRRQSARARASS